MQLNTFMRNAQFPKPIQSNLINLFIQAIIISTLSYNINSLLSWYNVIWVRPIRWTLFKSQVIMHDRSRYSTAFGFRTYIFRKQSSELAINATIRSSYFFFRLGEFVMRYLL